MRWLAVAATVAACQQDAAQPPAPARPPPVENAPHIEIPPGPIVDEPMWCSRLVRGPNAECNRTTTVSIGIGPWIAAGTLLVTPDPIVGEIDVQPVVQTDAGWWPVGARVDCGHMSERGSCKLVITDAKVRNDELVLAYELRGRTIERVTLTCRASKNAVTCVR